MLGLEHFISSFGYLALFILIAGQGFGLPISSEVLLPFTGVLVGQGLLNLELAILVAAIADTLGGIIGYVLADKIGRAAVIKAGQILKLNEGHFESMEKFYARYGIVAVIVGRLLPIIRGYTGYPAGFSKMSLKQFIPATFIGSLIWVTGLILAGFLLGQHFGQIATWLGPIGLILVILAILGLVVSGFFYLKKYKK